MRPAAGAGAAAGRAIARQPELTPVSQATCLPPGPSRKRPALSELSNLKRAQPLLLREGWQLGWLGEEGRTNSHACPQPPLLSTCCRRRRRCHNCDSPRIFTCVRTVNVTSAQQPSQGIKRAPCHQVPAAQAGPAADTIPPTPPGAYLLPPPLTATRFAAHLYITFTRERITESVQQRHLENRRSHTGCADTGASARTPKLSPLRCCRPLRRCPGAAAPSAPTAGVGTCTAVRTEGGRAHR